MNQETLELVRRVVEARQAYVKEPDKGDQAVVDALQALDAVETWVDAEPDTADGLQAIYEVQVAASRAIRMEGTAGSRSALVLALDDLTTWFWRYVQHGEGGVTP